MKKLLLSLLSPIMLWIPAHAQTTRPPDDATLTADQIIYWVGSGGGRAVVAVNWAAPDTCLAWGVRFDGDSALVADLLRTVAVFDDRFRHTSANGMVDSIGFRDGDLTLQRVGDRWGGNINGAAAPLGILEQRIGNGDFVKFGDESCGIPDSNFQYAWPTPVTPVWLPDQTALEFDDSVGSVGCQAIRFDNPSIIGWATHCVVTRGLKRISNEALGYADYGSDSDGTGPSSESTTNGVVSLGDAGTAVLTFDQPISNGEGYDFAVFENSLNHTFLEMAFVEVSSDGEHYHRFPAVSNTQNATQITNGGEVNPRKVRNLAGKYIVGWGTPFDLAELSGYSDLDIHHVTHVRIVDVVGCIDPQYGSADKNGRIINDPYPTPWGSCGFDLSGVAVMNGWLPGRVPEQILTEAWSAYPNPCTSTLLITHPGIGTEVVLLNALGQRVWAKEATGEALQINMQDYPSGLYIIQCGGHSRKVIKR